MAGILPPGIGNPQQAMQATAFIRSEPWYLQWINSLGKRPDANGNVSLSDAQRDQLRDMAVSHGIGLNNKFDGIDENGQIVEEHHKLRNTLVGAAIGGAALTGFGAAGIGPLAGAFGGASAAGAGAGSVGAGLSAGATGAGVAGGTAAGVGAGVGTAATGAGWFSPAVIGAGISGGLSLVGAHQQANASEEAARLEDARAGEALKDARDQRAWQQAQYANYLERLRPYSEMGTRANSTLSSLLASSPYARMVNAPQPSPAVPVGSGMTDLAAKMAGNTGYTGGGAPQGELVLLKAPNGMTKQVPADQADHFLSRGAQRV